MKTLQTILLTACMLTVTTVYAQAQEGLQISTLFEKYGNRDSVTMVTLNGSILRSYDMTLYKSLVFKDVKPYMKEISQCLQQAIASRQTAKRQEVTESGQLLSAYYQLSAVKRKGRKTRRYILFKRNRADMATLIYIEGPLTESDLMDMLRDSADMRVRK